MSSPASSSTSTAFHLDHTNQGNVEGSTRTARDEENMSEPSQTKLQDAQPPNTNSVEGLQVAKSAATTHDLDTGSPGSKSGVSNRLNDDTQEPGMSEIVEIKDATPLLGHHSPSTSHANSDTHTDVTKFAPPSKPVNETIPSYPLSNSRLLAQPARENVKNFLNHPKFAHPRPGQPNRLKEFLSTEQQNALCNASKELIRQAREGARYNLARPKLPENSSPFKSLPVEKQQAMVKAAKELNAHLRVAVSLLPKTNVETTAVPRVWSPPCSPYLARSECCLKVYAIRGGGLRHIVSCENYERKRAAAKVVRGVAKL